MYGTYSTYGSSSSTSGMMGLFALVAIAVCIVNIVAIYQFIRIADQKKTDLSHSMLWVIGLLTPFVVLPLLVIAMPDRSLTTEVEAPKPQNQPPSI